MFCHPGSQNKDGRRRQHSNQAHIEMQRLREEHRPGRRERNRERNPQTSRMRSRTRQTSEGISKFFIVIHRHSRRCMMQIFAMYDVTLQLFDMKKFQSNVNRELRRAYPDRRRLECQCLSAIAFVKSEPDVLECPIWVLIINVVAMDMLKSKLPPGKFSGKHVFKRIRYDQPQISGFKRWLGIPDVFKFIVLCRRLR